LVAACALLSLEAFIPHFGISGILGIASFVGSVIMTLLYVPFGLYYVIGEFAIFGAVIYLAYKLLFKPRFKGEVVLNDTLQVSQPDVDVNGLLGKEGVATTPLKPTGFADFNGTILEVSSEGAYIGERSRIKVIDRINNRPVVRLIKEPNAN
jgi:membrane-bound serine protease (ClpP class)